MLAAWHTKLAAETLFAGKSLNLDFRSAPYFSEHPLVESHYLPKRSCRQPSILTFLAQTPTVRSSATQTPDINKSEEAEELFRFIDFWTRHHGSPPQHLVFDSEADLPMTGSTGSIRRRSPSLPCGGVPPACLPRSPSSPPRPGARSPSIFPSANTARRASLNRRRPAQRIYRQFFITDLGHDEPTILLTNDTDATARQLIARYAKRMLIENALADAVRFFHIDALSSSVGFKVDFDMALLVLASGLYRLMARRMRGYDDAQARQIFRDLIDMPADVAITENEITVRFHRRAHLPIVLASGLFDKPVAVPWWNGRPLRLVE